MKVLLILLQPSYCVGGMEKYNLELHSVLKSIDKSIEIHELALDPVKQHDFSGRKNYFQPRIFCKNRVINYVGFYWRARILFKDLNNKNRYDLIINSTVFHPGKKYTTRKNYVWIQHENLDRYTCSDIKNFIVRFLKKVYLRIFLKIPNIFKTSANIVVFDSACQNYLLKKFKVDSTPIPLTVANHSNGMHENDILTRNKIIYLGRIDEDQKNISSLIEINKKLNGIIDFYGPESLGKQNNYLLKELQQNGWYKGVLSNINKYQVISRYKFCILISNCEGFSYSLVESLSCAVPLIVRNSYLSAPYVCNQFTGYLLPEKVDTSEYADRIDEIYHKSNYLNLVKTSFQFFKNNLTQKVFIKSWTSLINSIIKLKKYQK